MQIKKAKVTVIQSDPENIPVDLLPPGEDEHTQQIISAYHSNWKAIRTTSDTGNIVQDRYNFRLERLALTALYSSLMEIFQEQTLAFKLNVSYGFILRNNITKELRYWHSSQNNGRVFERPPLIQTREDFESALEQLNQEDVLEWAIQHRPNSKWVVDIVTNLTVFVNKIPKHSTM